MGSKKKTTQTSNQTSTNTVAPPSWTQGGLTQAGGMVQNALGQIPTSTYQGPMLAVQDQAQTQALADMYRQLGVQSGEAGGQLQQQMQGFTNTPLSYNAQLPTLNAFQNSAPQDLTGVISASIHPVMQQLTEQILPGIRSSAIESGAYSGDRAMGVVPGQAINGATDAASRIAAQIGFQDYNNREDRRLSSWDALNQAQLQAYGLDTNRTQGEAGLMTQRMGMLPDLLSSAMQLKTAQADLTGMGMGLEQQQRQQVIDEALQREQYNINRPFAGLDIATNLLQGLSGNYGTQTSTGSGTSTSVEKTGGLGPIAQGLMGGLAAAGSMAAGVPGGGSMFSSLFGGGGMGQGMMNAIGNQAASIPIPSFAPQMPAWPSASLFAR